MVKRGQHIVPLKGKSVFVRADFNAPLDVRSGSVVGLSSPSMQVKRAQKNRPPNSCYVHCASPLCSAAHASTPPSDLCAATRCPLENIEMSSCDAPHACPPLYYGYGDGSHMAHLRRGRVGWGASARTPMAMVVDNFSFACTRTTMGEPVEVAGFDHSPFSLPDQLSYLTPSHQLTCGILTEMSLFFKLCVDLYCAIPADLCKSVTQGVVPAGEDKDDPKQLWHHLQGRWPSDQQKPHLRSQTQHTQRHHRATAAEERPNYLSGLIPKLVKPNSVDMVTTASKPTSYSIDAQVVFDEMQQGFRTWIQRQPDTRRKSCCPSLIDALLGGCSSIGAHCVRYLLKEYALATKFPDWIGCTQSQKLRSYRGNIPGLRPIPWPSFILLSRENKLTKSSVMVTASAIQAFVNLVLTPCDAGYSIVMSAPNYFITYMSFQMTGVIDILVGGCDSRTLHHDVDWLEKVLKDKEHVPKLVTVLKKVRNLLDLSKDNLQIKESKIQGIYISRAIEIFIFNSSDVLENFFQELTTVLLGKHI
jgi:hypothetical protein